MPPYVEQSAAGIKRMDSISMKFDKGVGFSNGCAELTLKNPPPFVPNCLMAICEAAGPTARTCSVTVFLLASVVGWSNVTVLYGLNVCTTPCDTSTRATTNASGKRI